VTQLDRSSRVWREEVFGPLAVLQPFDDLSEAVELANDSHYGLAATVWTNCSRDAHMLARSLEVGLEVGDCLSDIPKALLFNTITLAGGRGHPPFIFAMHQW
jgi:hypothetical protein